MWHVTTRTVGLQHVVYMGCYAYHGVVVPQVHCPAAFRSDSAGSLTDVRSSKQQKQQEQLYVPASKLAAANKQQQHQCTSPADGSQLWRYHQQQQQQQVGSIGGCSDCGCEPLTPSSCSGSSVTGGSSCSSSSVLKCGTDLHYGGTAVGVSAAVAAGGGVAVHGAAPTVWVPQYQAVYDQAMQQQQQQQHSALSPAAAHAALPGQ